MGLPFSKALPAIDPSAAILPAPDAQGICAGQIFRLIQIIVGQIGGGQFQAAFTMDTEIGMIGKFSSLRCCGILLAALGMAVPVATALAQPAPREQPSEQITVFAPYLVQKKQIKTDIRMPVLYISIRRAVSYADLDLTEAADAAKFESRIHEAADAACKQFDILYPPQAYVPLSNVQDCARLASDQAMSVAREIIVFWRKAPH